MFRGENTATLAEVLFSCFGAALKSGTGRRSGNEMSLSQNRTKASIRIADTSTRQMLIILAAFQRAPCVLALSFGFCQTMERESRHRNSIQDEAA